MSYSLRQKRGICGGVTYANQQNLVEYTDSLRSLNLVLPYGSDKDLDRIDRIINLQESALVPFCLEPETHYNLWTRIRRLPRRAYLLSLPIILKHQAT